MTAMGGNEGCRSGCDATPWTAAVLSHPQLKLEDYKKRLSKGEVLNKDQMVRPGCMAPPWGQGV